MLKGSEMFKYKIIGILDDLFLTLYLYIPLNKCPNY